MGMIVTDLAAGTAAEHLVCADLLLSGYRAFLSDQNCPYDVAVEVDGRLIRIQVKSTRSQKATPQRVAHTPTYLWHTKRAGKGGRRRYKDEFDILALVALDIRVVAYIRLGSVGTNCVLLRPPGTVVTSKARKLKNIDHYPFSEAIAEIIECRK
jgi:hypothetical protein